MSASNSHARPHMTSTLYFPTPLEVRRAAEVLEKVTLRENKESGSNALSLERRYNANQLYDLAEHWERQEAQHTQVADEMVTDLEAVLDTSIILSAATSGLPGPRHRTLKMIANGLVARGWQQKSAGRRDEMR